LRIFSQFRERAKQFPSLSDYDLWLQIVTLFFEELNQLDFNKDKSKVASKILGRVKNHLRDYFTGLFKSLSAQYELEKKPELIPSGPSQLDVQEIESLLQDLVDSDVISEADKYILLATTIYGKSMKELSQELRGLTYANIRQRKVRAKDAVYRYLLGKMTKVKMAECKKYEVLSSSNMFHA
jgi:hypothetical protein